MTGQCSCDRRRCWICARRHLSARNSASVTATQRDVYALQDGTLDVRQPQRCFGHGVSGSNSRYRGKTGWGNSFTLVGTNYNNSSYGGESPKSSYTGSSSRDTCANYLHDTHVIVTPRANAHRKLRTDRSQRDNHLDIKTFGNREQKTPQ